MKNKNINKNSSSETGTVNRNDNFNFRNLSAKEKSINLNQKNDTSSSNIEKIYFMKEILEMIENSSDNNDYNNNNMLKIKATITQMKHNNVYPGCLDSKCKRKIIFNEEKREWNCNYCSKTFEKPCYYYNFSLRVKDSSSEQWIDFIGTNVEKILKISAEDYIIALLPNNYQKLNEINDNLESKTFYFWVKPTIESFNGNSIKKIYAYNVENVISISEAI